MDDEEPTGEMIELSPESITEIRAARLPWWELYEREMMSE